MGQLPAPHGILSRRCAPAGFLVAIIVSMLWPEPGEAVAHYKVRGMARQQLALQVTCGSG